jgi:hypothetical protein
MYLCCQRRISRNSKMDALGMDGLVLEMLLKEEILKCLNGCPWDEDTYSK